MTKKYTRFNLETELNAILSDYEITNSRETLEKALNDLMEQNTLDSSKAYSALINRILRDNNDKSIDRKPLNSEALLIATRIRSKKAKIQKAEFHSFLFEVLNSWYNDDRVESEQPQQQQQQQDGTFVRFKKFFLRLWNGDNGGDDIVTYHPQEDYYGEVTIESFDYSANDATVYAGGEMAGSEEESSSNNNVTPPLATSKEAKRPRYSEYLNNSLPPPPPPPPPPSNATVDEIPFYFPSSLCKTLFSSHEPAPEKKRQFESMNFVKANMDVDHFGSRVKASDFGALIELLGLSSEASLVQVPAISVNHGGRFGTLAVKDFFAFGTLSGYTMKAEADVIKQIFDYVNQEWINAIRYEVEVDEKKTDNSDEDEVPTQNKAPKVHGVYSIPLGILLNVFAKAQVSKKEIILSNFGGKHPKGETYFDIFNEVANLKEGKKLFKVSTANFNAAEHTKPFQPQMTVDVGINDLVSDENVWIFRIFDHNVLKSELKREFVNGTEYEVKTKITMFNVGGFEDCAMLIKLENCSIVRGVKLVQIKVYQTRSNAFVKDRLDDGLRSTLNFNGRSLKDSGLRGFMTKLDNLLRKKGKKLFALQSTPRANYRIELSFSLLVDVVNEGVLELRKQSEKMHNFNLNFERIFGDVVKKVVRVVNAASLHEYHVTRGGLYQRAAFAYVNMTNWLTIDEVKNRSVGQIDHVKRNQVRLLGSFFSFWTRSLGSIMDRLMLAAEYEDAVEVEDWSGYPQLEATNNMLPNEAWAALSFRVWTESFHLLRIGKRDKFNEEEYFFCSSGGIVFTWLTLHVNRMKNNKFRLNRKADDAAENSEEEGEKLSFIGENQLELVALAIVNYGFEGVLSVFSNFLTTTRAGGNLLATCTTKVEQVQAMRARLLDGLATRTVSFVKVNKGRRELGLEELSVLKEAEALAEGVIPVNFCDTGYFRAFMNAELRRRKQKLKQPKRKKKKPKANKPADESTPDSSDSMDDESNESDDGSGTPSESENDTGGESDQEGST